MILYDSYVFKYMDDLNRQSYEYKSCGDCVILPKVSLSSSVKYFDLINVIFFNIEQERDYGELLQAR